MKVFLIVIAMAGLLLSGCKDVRGPSDKKLLEIDSTQIEGWEVIPAKELKTPRYAVSQKDTPWQVILGSGEVAMADPGYIRRGIHHLANLVASEEINVDEKAWDTMGVTDKGTRVKVTKEGKQVLEMIVGKMFFGNNRTTYYVRKADESTVYALPLYLEGSIIADPDRVRQKDLFPSSIGKVVEIKFLKAEGTLYTVKRDIEEGGWLIDTEKADETRVNAYLTMLHGLEINKFSAAPVTGAAHAIMITSADGSVSQVRISQKNSDTWVMYSPENPGNFAEIDKNALLGLFPGKVYFQGLKK